MLLRLENATAAMTRMTREQDQTANNLANANTSGYKKGRLFTQALNERLDAEGAPRSDRRMNQAPDLSQGVLKQTGNPLDVALNGDGFFALQDRATGMDKFTRAGHFVTGPEGQLQTPTGDPVMGEGGPVQVPQEATSIEISRTGVITADGQRLGKLRVVRFENAGQINRLDDTAFAGNNPVDVEAPEILQGHLEGSNVDPVKEMVNMIEHFRTFEIQQRTLRSTDQSLSQAMRDLGGL